MRIEHNKARESHGNRRGAAPAGSRGFQATVNDGPKHSQPRSGDTLTSDL